MSMASKAPFNPKVVLPKPRKFKSAKGTKTKKMKGFKSIVERTHKEELNKEGHL